MVLTHSSGHGGDIRCARILYGIDDVLDFSSNINPLGLPKGFYQALGLAFDEIILYPEIAHHPLSETLPQSLGIEPGKILLGNGSTELLYLLPFVMKPKRFLVCSPAYSDYQRSFQRAGITVDFFFTQEKDNFRLDLSQLKISSDDLVVLGNPNNPTSVYTPKNEILDFVLSHSKTWFLVDEAFIDFLPRGASLINADMPPNLLVLKSLTKFYAIPGLRLGCLVASPETINRIKEFQEPWTVNCMAARAGEFLLSRTDHAEETRAFAIKEKEYLFNELTAIPGLKPFPPAVNFILVKITPNDITSTFLKDNLARKGILIRDCSNFKGLSNRYFRVSVNPRKQNKILLAALRKAFNG